MGTAYRLIAETRRQLGYWSWYKKVLLAMALLSFGTSSFLYLTPPGLAAREFLAQTVISTQHRDWAWIFVGAARRDDMVKLSHQFTESSALEKQDLGLIKHKRTIDELISDVMDISGPFWKGKMIYVYDPTSVRVVVPNKQGEGERISSMVRRTGAVAGINGGGFIDPDGLGNGFAPIGLIMSGSEPVYSDVDADTPQHIVGFTKEGTLLVGKYSLHELQQLGATDVVSFLAPRLIANGNPQITSGDGGWGRAPRTAIGQREDGTLIFVVIDGRQTHSVGATLREVQDLLLKEGAVNAGLLDGGASSELVVGGEVVTKPSSRYGERRLPSGFVVLDDPSSYKVDRIWDGLTKIDPGGAYDHPDYLREQEELKKKQQQQTNKNTPANTGSAGSTGGSGESKQPAGNSGANGAAGSGSGAGAGKAGASSGASSGGKPGAGTPGAGGADKPPAGAGAPSTGGGAAATPPSGSAGTSSGTNAGAAAAGTGSIAGSGSSATGGAVTGQAAETSGQTSRAGSSGAGATTGTSGVAAQQTR